MEGGRDIKPDAANRGRSTVVVDLTGARFKKGRKMMMVGLICVLVAVLGTSVITSITL